MGTDLMNNTTSYDEINSKYRGFKQPVFSLSLIKKADREKFVFSDLNIELTCGFSANMATVNVYGVYDNKEKKFITNDFDNVFHIGDKIEIEVGYVNTTECVFSGFIGGITYLFSDNKEPAHITLECFDVKAIMMFSNNYAQIKQDNYGASVSKIIENSLYKSYYKNADVDGSIQFPEGDNKPMIEMVNESDYDFIVRIAKKYGYEFFVSQNTVYFRKAKLNTNPILLLSHRDLIIEIEVNYNIMGLVNLVEIRSMNDNTGEVISAIANSNAALGTTSAPSKIIGKSKKTIIDSTILSDTEAKSRAEAELKTIEQRFGTIKMKTVGIPELIPGRFVSIKGMGNAIDKRVYITKVKHQIDNDNGFTTFVEARLDTL